MAHLYPILLDVRDRLVVIVGGGAVGARKARGLVECGATRVRVVSPAFDAQVPEAVERVAETYDRRHLAGASLVYAATDVAAVNEAVVRDARSAGVWVNRADADDDAPGDFVTPARARVGPVTLAVSAGSPTVSALLRDRLAAQLETRYLRLATAVESLRTSIVAQADLDPPTRRGMLRSLTTDDAVDVLERDGEAALTNWLARQYPQWRPGR